MAKRISKAKLQEAEFIRLIGRFTKVENCVLCGKKMTSACNSHVVPQFILKEIAENGHVSYGFAFHTININGLVRTTGVKNAYTFKLICKDCDRKTFHDYENPLNLENFDLLDLNTRKKILCEMAIKTHLSHISMKYRSMVARYLSTVCKRGTIEQEGKIIFPERIDIEEHKRYIQMLRKFIKNNKNPFVVLYDKVLDYKTKLATQTVINYNYDLTGKQVFDPNLVINENECRYFYLMILPQKDKTRILFYIEKEYLPNVQVIVDQFQSLSDEDKLHFLFISLLIHDQQFYMAPSFAETIFKKDKKIVKLYVKTEVSTRYQSKIKNFRKYTNYLLKEYN